MMEKSELLKIQEIVTGTYKSLEHPDFSFVKKGFSSRPYDPLIKRLRDYAAVEECTEAEDDVCFSYFLKGRDSLWKLDLSLVGPFGLFVRLKARIGTEDFLCAGKGDLNGYERKILDLLKNSGIKLLTVKDLSQEVPMTLFNTGKGKVCLYQALFSDREALPWQQ